MKFWKSDPKPASNLILEKLECKSTLLDCLKDLSTLQVISASQNLGNWPFGLFVGDDLISENYDVAYEALQKRFLKHLDQSFLIIFRNNKFAWNGFLVKLKAFVLFSI
jgi:hypothetical protein